MDRQNIVLEIHFDVLNVLYSSSSVPHISILVGTYFFIGAGLLMFSLFPRLPAELNLVPLSWDAVFVPSKTKKRSKWSQTLEAPTFLFFAEGIL